MTAVVAGAVALLPLVLPWSDLIGVPALSDSFSLLPWWDVNDAGVPVAWLGVVAAALGAAVALAVALTPVRLARLLPFVVLVFLVAEHDSVQARVEQASAGSLFQAQGTARRDWIDAIVPDGDEVVHVWSSRPDERTVFVNEFFNRSIGRVFYTGAPTPGGLPEYPVSVDAANGRLLDPWSRPILAPYALTDTSVRLAGDVVARDPRPGMVLRRVHGPLRLTYVVDGLYEDAWSGPRVTYTRFRCRGGTGDVRRPVGRRAVLAAATRDRVERAAHGARVRGPRDDAPRACPARPGRRPLRGGAARAADGRSGPCSPRRNGRAAARRPCARLPLPAVRIAIDVSPLALPRTGIGNWLRGAVAGLAEAAADDEIVPFAVTGRRGGVAIPAALRGVAPPPRLVRLPVARAWRAAWSRARHPALERVLGRFDVLHYSDWWFPPQAGGVRATMIHDLVPLTHPEWVQRRTRRLHLPSTATLRARAT